MGFKCEGESLFMRCARYLVIFLAYIQIAQAQTERNIVDYGLVFSSHEVSKDHRTSLNLNPQYPFEFKKDFGLKFDIAFRRLTNAYGYIVRVIANDSVNIDLVSSPEHNEFSDLTLIINNEPTGLHFDFTEIGLSALQWNSIEIFFSHDHNQVSLSWNGKLKSQPFNMKALKNFRFYFGVNEFGKFNTTDAPPIILRNVMLSRKEDIAYKWILKNHNDTLVYDSVSNTAATVANPMWLIDKHTRFTHRKSFTIDRYPSVAFNGETGVMYATDEKSFYVYDVGQDKLERRTVNGNSIYTDANQLLYIKQTGKLINYDVLMGKFTTLDLDNNVWTNNDTTYSEPNYWHNNKFYNPFDSSVYVFGGYGHFTYKNAFFRYDKTAKEWVSVETVGSIPPRYLAASGVRSSTGEVLIFGGYGSISGKQELSPQSFYDLYAFDLKTRNIKKVWDFPTPQFTEDMVFSNSLVVNEREKCFYVLSFPKNRYESTIRIRQYSIDKPETKVLADSIPFKFHDEDSFCDLFLSEATNELIAVTVHSDKQQYQVNVYAINYPPLQSEDVRQGLDHTTANNSLFIMFISIAGAAAVVFVWIMKYRRTLSVNAHDRVHTASTPSQLIIPHGEHRLTSSVLLFGGFQVFDKNGVDISGKFTMTLKELFTMVLLHSVKYEKGISATVLQENLWHDKDEVSARNNRNVNIKKLRGLLEEIGNVTIENNNSYLRLNTDSHFSCDYETVHKILEADATAGFSEQQKIQLILKNVKRGSLLPNIQKTWLDNFKSDISNQIIDMLLEYARKLDANKEDKLLLEIADAIFNYDSINQEALVIKCSVLNKKGKYALAKNWYDHFVKEYKNLYAENYPRTFEQVISHMQPF